MVPYAVVVGSSIFFSGITPNLDVNCDWLIVPGKRVGKVHLGAERSKVMATLGQPKKVAGMEGDAAMGHIWTVWPGNHGHQLDVYTVRREDDSAGNPRNIVRQIRLTSPSFFTSTGVRVGESLRDIQAKSMRLSLVKDSPALKIFDDVRHGIAFEFTKSKVTWRCAAITIHPKHSKVLGEYLPFNS